MYAYLIVPPVPGHRLGPLRLLLRREHVRATSEGRTWVGRLVLERRITHILVVSDGPGQRRSIDDEIVAELRSLKAHVVTTSSLELAGDDNASGPGSTPRLVP